MKKFSGLLLGSVLLMSSAIAQTNSKAVYDGKSKQYKVEKGAKIIVGVDNDAWGNAIVELWNKKHPEYKGVVTFQNFGSAGGIDQINTKQGEAPDLCFVIDGEVSRGVQSLSTFEKTTANVAKKVAQDTFFNNVNKNGKTYYVPVAYDGMAFSWNKTMMEALGMDTTDKNKDGLPDAYDTWEEIFAWSKSLKTRPQYKGKDVNVVFPMNLDNQWAFYSSLTAAGWEIYKEGDPTKPGFEKKEFLAAFDFVKAASDARISVEVNGEKTPAASMGWRWDDYLNSEISPFALVGTWMDVDAATKATGAEFKFSSMPTWKGKKLTPFVKTKGWVINGFTKYPSATAELLRILLSTEGMQSMIDNSSYIPSLKAKAPITPDYSNDRVKQEMSAAFAYNYPEPGMALPNNASQPCMNVYYNIQIEQSYYGVYDGTRTAEEAQKEIVKNAAAWLEQNNK